MTSSSLDAIPSTQADQDTGDRTIAPKTLKSSQTKPSAGSKSTSRQKPQVSTSRPASKKTATSKTTAKVNQKQTTKQAKKQSKKVKNMPAKLIPIFFERLREQRPNPTTELNFSSPFELLIAVLLSAQSTDVGVNKATDKLFPIANTPEKILALGLEGLKEYIKTIGLYNTKALNTLKTCQILIEQHNSQVPESREALEALPGVGRKTANVVLNTAFGHPTMAVDTHIFRLGNRTGLAVGKDVLAVEKRLIQVIPDEFIRDAHHWLILHGRYCCIARKPKCGECVVSDLCQWPERFDYGAPQPIALAPN